MIPHPSPKQYKSTARFFLCALFINKYENLAEGQILWECIAGLFEVDLCCIKFASSFLRDNLPQGKWSAQQAKQMVKSSALVRPPRVLTKYSCLAEYQNHFPFKKDIIMYPSFKELQWQTNETQIMQKFICVVLVKISQGPPATFSED